MKFESNVAFFGVNKVLVKEIEFDDKNIILNQMSVPSNGNKFNRCDISYTSFCDVELTTVDDDNGTYFSAAFKPGIQESFVQKCGFINTNPFRLQLYLRIQNQDQWTQFMEIIEPVALNVFPYFQSATPTKAEAIWKACDKYCEGMSKLRHAPKPRF